MRLCETVLVHPSTESWVGFLSTFDEWWKQASESVSGIAHKGLNSLIILGETSVSSMENLPIFQQHWVWWGRTFVSGVWPEQEGWLNSLAASRRKRSRSGCP
jgi:hypothetical protein